jgi:hypothetical protein
MAPIAVTSGGNPRSRRRAISTEVEHGAFLRAFLITGTAFMTVFPSRANRTGRYLVGCQGADSAFWARERWLRHSISDVGSAAMAFATHVFAAWRSPRFPVTLSLSEVTCLPNTGSAAASFS